MSKAGLFAIVIGVVAAATLAASPAHVAASGGAYQCKNQTLTGATISGNLVVPERAFCDLTSGTHVTGDATVQPNGGLSSDSSSIDGTVRVQKKGQFTAFNGSTVGHDVLCNDCGVADVQSSTVGGNLQDNGVSQGAFIKNDQISGDLWVHDSTAVPHGPFDIEGNQVGGNLFFNHNKGTSTISNNTITVGLDCAGNKPPPTGSGNTAAQKKGQCSAL